MTKAERGSGGLGRKAEERGTGKGGGRRKRNEDKGYMYQNAIKKPIILLNDLKKQLKTDANQENKSTYFLRKQTISHCFPIIFRKTKIY